MQSNFPKICLTYGEDTVQMLQVASYSNTAFFVDKCLYSYRIISKPSFTKK